MRLINTSRQQYSWYWFSFLFPGGWCFFRKKKVILKTCCFVFNSLNLHALPCFKGKMFSSSRVTQVWAKPYVLLWFISTVVARIFYFQTVASSVTKVFVYQTKLDASLVKIVGLTSGNLRLLTLVKIVLSYILCEEHWQQSSALVWVLQLTTIKPLCCVTTLGVVES